MGKGGCMGKGGGMGMMGGGMGMVPNGGRPPHAMQIQLGAGQGAGGQQFQHQVPAAWAPPAAAEPPPPTPEELAAQEQREQKEAAAALRQAVERNEGYFEAKLGSGFDVWDSDDEGVQTRLCVEAPTEAGKQQPAATPFFMQVLGQQHVST
mmetsp:Transcript_30509/g.77697  ORF Transcript_30509/g.77697 Transcript_30509/m.77697 type:complete len:151 (-) Transcript_30509:145-597(-)